MTGCAVEFLGVYLITSKRTKAMTPLSLSDDRLELNDEAVNMEDPTEPHRTRFAPDPVLPTRRPAPLDALPTSPTREESMQRKQQQHRRRRSSVFRGISLTSQLVDRLNDDDDQQVQLPSSPTWSDSQYRRRSRPEGLNILSSLRPTQNEEDPVPTADADAVEIEIPTASSLPSSQRNSTAHDDDSSHPVIHSPPPTRHAHHPPDSGRLVNIDEE